MGANSGCYGCGGGSDAMASVFSGQQPAGERVTVLCLDCFALAEKRAALAQAFTAGDLGADARLLWFHELSGGGAQLLQADRSKAYGRAIARFIADLPASSVRVRVQVIPHSSLNSCPEGGAGG